MKIVILTSSNQWFIPFAKILSSIYKAPLFFDHKDIKDSFDICFILSYHNIVPQDFLANNAKNIVVHASDLPNGKGWAPLFWQILEGRNDIVFSMFEANAKADNGDIYLKKTLHLTGTELYEEIREKQGEFVIKICQDFINSYDKYKTPTPQRKVSLEDKAYKKRNITDSELDVNKSIKEQFDLLRVSSYKDFPAFFEINGVKYKVKIKPL